MKFLSFKSKQPALLDSAPSTPELLDADTPEILTVQQNFPANPFFSFTYYSQEMQITNGMTHLKFEKIRFEDGKLKSEKIESHMSADIYTQAVHATQRLIADQTIAMMKQFTSLLSFPTKNPNAKE